MKLNYITSKTHFILRNFLTAAARLDAGDLGLGDFDLDRGSICDLFNKTYEVSKICVCLQKTWI